MNQINSNKESNLFLVSNVDTTKLSQKESFLKYLQEMNLDMLDLVLSEEATYFGAPKSVFMEKLSHIKNQHKLSGCNESFKIKKYKSIKNYYALLLPFLGICNKFIIEEKSDKIVKIYNNKIVKTKEELEALSQFEFFFGDDEKTDFCPSTEYVMALYNCTKAYEELVNDKPTILTSKNLQNWLYKNAFFYEYVYENFLFFRLDNFRYLYFSLQFIFEQIKNYSKVIDALKSFPGSFCFTRLLIEWLNKYSDLYYCNTQFFGMDFAEIDVLNKTMKCDKRHNLYFKGDDFFAIFLFNELYQRNRDRFKK